MSTDDPAISRLRYGAIIYANFPASGGGYKAGKHPAIMLDSDAEIDEARAIIDAGESPIPDFFVVVVSHNDTIDPDCLYPAPRRAGLTGYVQCGYVETVSLAAILGVDPQRVLPVEMLPIQTKIRECRDKKRKPKGN